MYIDESRLADLRRIDVMLADEKVSLVRKRMLRRARDTIIGQLKDKKLAAMRERLVKAAKADDKYEMWKISNQINDYLGKEKLEEGTW